MRKLSQMPGNSRRTLLKQVAAVAGATLAGRPLATAAVPSSGNISGVTRNGGPSVRYKAFSLRQAIVIVKC